METLARPYVLEGVVLLGICNKLSCSNPTGSNSILGKAKTLLDDLKICDDDRQVELEEFSKGTGYEPLNNVGRAYKTTFRYSGSGKFYTWTLSRVIRHIICSRTVYVTYYYIIHSPILDSTLVLFESTQGPSSVNNS